MTLGQIEIALGKIKSLKELDSTTKNSNSKKDFKHIFNAFEVFSIKIYFEILWLYLIF